MVWWHAWKKRARARLSGNTDTKSSKHARTSKGDSAENYETTFLLFKPTLFSYVDIYIYKNYLLLQANSTPVSSHLFSLRLHESTSCGFDSWNSAILEYLVGEFILLSVRDLRDSNWSQQIEVDHAVPVKFKVVPPRWPHRVWRPEDRLRLLKLENMTQGEVDMEKRSEKLRVKSSAPAQVRYKGLDEDTVELTARGAT